MVDFNDRDAGFGVESSENYHDRGAGSDADSKFVHVPMRANGSLASKHRTTGRYRLFQRLPGVERIQCWTPFPTALAVSTRSDWHIRVTAIARIECVNRTKVRDQCNRYSCSASGSQEFHLPKSRDLICERGVVRQSGDTKFRRTARPPAECRDQPNFEARRVGYPFGNQRICGVRFARPIKRRRDGTGIPDA